MSRLWENATKIAFAEKVIEILEDYDTWSNLDLRKSEALDRIVQEAVDSQGVNLS